MRSTIACLCLGRLERQMAPLRCKPMGSMREGEDAPRGRNVHLQRLPEDQGRWDEDHRLAKLGQVAKHGGVARGPIWTAMHALSPPSAGVSAC